MPQSEPEDSAVVLKLIVRNHPGVMSHVCGLFARRALNVDGIICLPTRDSTRSTVLLMVSEDERLEQMIAQIDKLEDVLEIHRAPDARQAFAAVAGHLKSL